MFTPDHPAYGWFGLNHALFFIINGFRSSLVDWSAVPISILGHPNMFPFYISAALWLASRRPSVLPLRNVVSFSLGYVIVSVLLVPILKEMLDFPRPLAALGARVHVLGTQDMIHAFPSGHAAFAVLAACSLAPDAARPLRWALGTLAVLVCISRVSVGAHFPADVVGGALIAVLVSMALRAVIRAGVPVSGGRS